MFKNDEVVTTNSAKQRIASFGGDVIVESNIVGNDTMIVYRDSGDEYGKISILRSDFERNDADEGVVWHAKCGLTLEDAIAESAQDVTDTLDWMS